MIHLSAYSLEVGTRENRERATYLIFPLCSQFITLTSKGHVELGLGRQAWSIEFGFPVNGSNLLLELLIAQAVEEIDKRIPELKRVERLSGPLCEVVRNELVKVLSANETVQVVKEVEALFVSNSAVNILRVHVIMADDEFCVFVVLAKVCNGIL